LIGILVNLRQVYLDIKTTVPVGLFVALRKFLPPSGIRIAFPVGLGISVFPLDFLAANLDIVH
jgi:hypothetical protein